MRLLSWNVNGIRACLKKGFEASIAQLQPQIILLQEIRSEPLSILREQYPFQVWNPSVLKKGYSGTALFSQIEPIKVETVLGVDAHDSLKEGRVIVAHFPS